MLSKMESWRFPVAKIPPLLGADFHGVKIYRPTPV
jgi:hypothetical protein